jgi:hypothetical protein
MGVEKSAAADFEDVGELVPLRDRARFWLFCALPDDTIQMNSRVLTRSVLSAASGPRIRTQDN